MGDGKGFYLLGMRQGTNPKQFEFLQLVVDRILMEAGLIQKERSVRQTDDPLVWLLHGPPGTGNSHVLGFLRQLLELVGYTYGLDWVLNQTGRRLRFALHTREEWAAFNQAN